MRYAEKWTEVDFERFDSDCAKCARSFNLTIMHTTKGLYQ